MPLSESDKVTITQYPPLPSKCCICHRGSNGSIRFLDFQMSLDVYGAVTICEECVAPVAQLFGYIRGDSFEASEESLMRVQMELERVQADNERLNSVMDSLLSLRPALSSNNSSSDAFAVEVIAEDPGQLELPISSEGTDDREADESSAKRRPKNVS